MAPSIKVFHVILDATQCAKDAGMTLEEWIQFTVDYGVKTELTPEKE